MSSSDGHWCLYQTWKCTRSFSKIFHKLWNPSNFKLYWIFFSYFQWLQISFLFCDCLLSLYMPVCPIFLHWWQGFLLRGGQGGHSTMEGIPPPLWGQPPPPWTLPPPWGIFSRCGGYLHAYNSLIYGIFILILCYEMSLSWISVFK